MKNMLRGIAIATFCMTLVLPAQADTGTTPATPLPEAPALDASAAQWNAFSANVRSALESGHEGLQQGAMRLVVRYGDRLDVKASTFDVMAIYRNHDNDNMRRLAVVALGNMQSDWAISFLKRAERFEKSTSVRQTIGAVVRDA